MTAAPPPPIVITALLADAAPILIAPVLVMVEPASVTFTCATFPATALLASDRPCAARSAPLMTLSVALPAVVVARSTAVPTVAVAALASVSMPVLPLPMLTPTNVVVSVVPGPVKTAVASPALPTAMPGADRSLPLLTVALALKKIVFALLQLTGVAPVRLKPPALTFKPPLFVNVFPNELPVNVTLLPATLTPDTFGLTLRLTA